MKKAILISFLLMIFSCNGQDSKNNPASNSKINKKMNSQNFDIDRFNKNKNEEGEYFYKDSKGNEVKETGDSESGYELYRKLSDKLFYTQYKSYYSSGKVKESGEILLDNTAVGVPVGIWEYFDENGNLMKEINENKKFGKIGPQEILQFLEEKKIINLKTGEGWHLKNNTNFFTINYNEIDKIWEIRSTKGTMGHSQNSPTGQALISNYYYEIDSNTGKVIKQFGK